VQRGYLDGQTRAALGSTASQHFAAVFRAHAFAKPVFSLLFEVRRLLKRKGHPSHPFDQKIPNERRIIGSRPQAVKPTADDDPVDRTSSQRKPNSSARSMMCRSRLRRFCGRFQKNGLDCPRLSTRMCVGTAITHCGIRASEAGISEPFWHCLCENTKVPTHLGRVESHAMRIEPSTTFRRSVI
jgi:hypothetical protein